MQLNKARYRSINDVSLYSPVVLWLFMFCPYTIIICILMSYLWETPVLNLIIPMIIAAYFCSVIVCRFRKATYSFLVAGLYIILVFLMLLDVKYKFLPLRGVDWRGYSQRAIINMQSGSSGLGLLFTQSTDLFAKCISVLYHFFGIYPSMIHCYVFLCSQMLVFVFLKLASEFFDDEEIGEKCAFFLCFIPAIVIHSISFLREIPIALCFVVSLLYFLRYTHTGRYFYFFMALIPAVISAVFHSGMIIVPFAYMVSLLLYKASKKEILFNVWNIALVLLLFVILFMSPIGESMMTKFYGKDIIASVGSDIPTEATTVYVSEAPESYGGLIIQTPVRFFLFELVPLPWHIRNLGTGISWLLDGILRLFLVYQIIKLIINMRKLDITPEKKIFIYVCIFIWIGFGILCGWGTKTYGTAIRHRVKILPMEILLAMQSSVLANEIKQNKSSQNSI